MNSTMEILYARRPAITYIAPAACEAIISGSALSNLLLILNPIGRIPRVGNLSVLGDVPGPFALTWETTPGDGPPIICYNIYQLVGGEMVLVAECVTPPPGGGGVPLPPGSPGGGDTYVVTPVTTEGEGPPSLPISTPIIPPEPPEDPCDGNEGEDTTCAYGPVGDRYRIKNFNSALFDISECGLSWTNCINCEIFDGDNPPGINCVDPVEWAGTWPVKVNDAQFIDQEFEPDPSCGSCFPSSCPGCEIPPAHLLHGFCINSQLITSGAANSTGCGWAITISAPFVPDVWTGVKTKGEGPVGKYFRVSGCCPGPECVEVEAY
jgi:hypothetical protein